MKRALIASILGIAASVVSSQGAGQIIFSTYLESVAPPVIVWGDTSAGHTLGQSISVTDGFHAELFYGLGSGLPFSSLVGLPSSVTQVGTLYPGTIIHFGAVDLPDWTSGPVTFGIQVYNESNYATATYRTLNTITWTEPASTIVPLGLPANNFTDSLLAAAFPSGVLPVFEVPENCTPHDATAYATISNGSVVSATINDGGCGYTSPPAILIQGGGGTGATATAVITNGVVVGITMTAGGTGYTNSPRIYVYFPRAITSQPHSLALQAFQTASFNVTASGTIPLTYQWSLNGTPIPGATASTLTISNITPADLGDYAVTVTDGFGSTVSSNATLSMYPIIISPFEGGVTYWGTNAAISVGAWGSEPLTYQWFFNGVAISNATSEILTIPNIQFTNAGLYSVVVSNPLGSVTNTPEQVVVNPAGVSIGLSPRITIVGTVGYNYIIQRTANLSDTNSWVTTAHLTLTQPTEIWVDTNINTSSPSNPQNYYRVLPGP